MKPLVSILIPAHKMQDSIAETLRSAVFQTWPRKEIIVVDDEPRIEQLLRTSVSSDTSENVPRTRELGACKK